MDHSPGITYIQGMSIAASASAKDEAAKSRKPGLSGLFRNPGLYLLTLFRGRAIGQDAVGNCYYERPGQLRTRRWVVYAGASDPSTIPPEWHAWLHRLTDAPISGPKYAWERPRLPNLTGTPLSYRPEGHDYKGGQRAAASADYESWTPDQA